jgi:hypothetical protein
MHPREPRRAWDRTTRQRAADVLAFVREHGPLHPRDVDRHFAHGRVRTYWGGSGSASTQLLDGLHHRGLVRVARRDSGVRIYAAIEHPPVANDPPARRARADALIDLVLRQYAPLPSSSLGYLVRMLGHGAPHLAAELAVALRAARTSLAQVALDGVTWYWPADARPSSARHAPPDRVRLLAPFDPVVWDRARFEALWGWAYRFEAYTPAARRKLGYCCRCWRDRVVGWGNASVTARGRLRFRWAMSTVAHRSMRDSARRWRRRSSRFGDSWVWARSRAVPRRRRHHRAPVLCPRASPEIENTIARSDRRISASNSVTASIRLKRLASARRFRAMCHVQP